VEEGLSERQVSETCTSELQRRKSMTTSRHVCRLRLQR
jgi:hypothetical protein